MRGYWGRGDRWAGFLPDVQHSSCGSCGSSGWWKARTELWEKGMVGAADEGDIDSTLSHLWLRCCCCCTTASTITNVASGAQPPLCLPCCRCAARASVEEHWQANNNHAAGAAAMKQQPPITTARGVTSIARVMPSVLLLLGTEPRIQCRCTPSVTAEPPTL